MELRNRDRVLGKLSLDSVTKVHSFVPVTLQEVVAFPFGKEIRCTCNPTCSVTGIAADRGKDVPNPGDLEERLEQTRGTLCAKASERIRWKR